MKNMIKSVKTTKAIKATSLKDLGIQFKETRSEKSYNELYKRIRPGLFHYIFGILGSVEDTDHAISLVMSSVYDKIDQYNTQWHISTWIYRIAYTVACMELRYKKQKKTTPMSYFENSENKNWVSKIEFESIENYTDVLIQREDADSQTAETQRVNRIIDSMPEEYQAVIREKFFNELSYEEIHTKLDIPLHTVKNRVARGKRLFKEIFEANEI
jgi:RNA polymerase sigma factor (sigma-70 family)